MRAEPQLRSRIEAANRTVLETFQKSRPIWFDVRPAIEALPGMTRDTILHAGPPIEWQRMCGPQRNGAIGAALYEGLAENRADAVARIEASTIRLAPCHDFGAVGGMAGITSASMPVAMVRDESNGAVGCSQLYQGPRGTLPDRDRYDREAARQWRWLADVLGPVLQAAVRASGGIDVRAVIAKALQMGDECHNRNAAGSALLLRELLPWMLERCVDRSTLRDSAAYLAQAEQFSLCVSMAAAKAAADAAGGLSHSTIVTAMARNGVDFGIRVSGLGEAWFTAPANRVQGLLFSARWNETDTVPDIGDSAIMGNRRTRRIRSGRRAGSAAIRGRLLRARGPPHRRDARDYDGCRRGLPDSEPGLRAGPCRHRHSPGRSHGHDPDYRHRDRAQEGRRHRRRPDASTAWLLQQGAARVCERLPARTGIVTTMHAPLLEVEDLHVRFDTREGPILAVSSVDFRVYPG